MPSSCVAFQRLLILDIDTRDACHRVRVWSLSLVRACNGVVYGGWNGQTVDGRMPALSVCMHMI
jgi:hypothetical protein